MPESENKSTPPEQQPIKTAVPVDLASLSVNFPPRPIPELERANVVNTLQALLMDGVYAASVEGPEGMGKTVVLSQFVHRFPSTAISVFVSPSNRLSFDVDLIRKDIATQAHWLLRGEVLGRDQYDSLLLKSYYSDLQRHAKRSSSTIYFVLDGVSELDESDRVRLLQQLADSLPIGVPQFRFLFSGDESIVKILFSRDLATKSYPLTEFSADEARVFFEDHDLSMEEVGEINGLCRGIPGRLAGVRRALNAGLSPKEFLQDAPSKRPEFFEVDWKQVDEKNDTVLMILALLAHDLKPHTVDDIASILNISDTTVLTHLNHLNFVRIEKTSSVVHFASIGLAKFVADRLKERRPRIQRLLIKRLLASPGTQEALLELPSKLEEAGEYSDLMDLLTPDHLLQVLERTQTLSKVDDAVQRGFRSAKKLGRDPDLLRFGLQQSIVAEIASANTWESEIAALAALRHDMEAQVLANSAMLREDRLLMLATLAHGIWLRGDPIQSELLESIKLLIKNLDYWSLGRRAGTIATKLTCVDADLANEVLTKAKWATDDSSLDHAFVGLAVSAMRDIEDEGRRDQMIESVARARRDPRARGMLEGVRALSGRALPEDVCARMRHVASADAQLSLLRYWCVLNSTQVGADSVAMEAIRIGLATPEARLDASLLADLSRAIVGAPTIERKKELVGMLDGLRGTAERLGPSVDYVRLQVSLALADGETDAAACEGRLMETFDYIARIGDLPSRGKAYATFLGGLKKLSPATPLQSGRILERSCADELDAVVLELSDATADHYLSLGDIITGLCPGDLKKALDYTKVVNTEQRRDAVLLDIVDTMLHRSISDIDPIELKQVLDSMAGKDKRDQGIVRVMERFADGQAIKPAAHRSLLPLMADIESIAASVDACRAFVRAIQILEKGPSTAEYVSLKDHLVQKLWSRWKHIDVEWVRIDAGFNIVRDLAAIDPNRAEELLKAVDEIKATCGVSAPKPAWAFVACIHLVVRGFCGLLPRRLETDTDLDAIAALIDVIPSYGERANLWADLSMRAAIVGRSDITELLVDKYCLPAFKNIPIEDAGYRASVLIQIAPALYRAQSATCMEEIGKLNAEDRDLALRGIISFYLFDRVPFDPVDKGARNSAVVNYERLLKVVELTERLETDWMIYAATSDTAELLRARTNQKSITIPQREDLTRRFSDLAKRRLPIAKQISHPGYLIATLAQALSFTNTRAGWSELIAQARGLSNIADRVFVLQIIALSLPKSMSSQSAELLEEVKLGIKSIPSALDQIERYLGLAEDVRNRDKSLCRDSVCLAAVAIRESAEDVHDQRRRLVDIAYRIDGDFANDLIDQFDDDDAKRRARSQMRLLEIREAIRESDGKLNEDKVLQRVRAGDIARLGTLLLRSLNAGRVQSYHPSEIRGYLDLVSEQPLRHTYSLLLWYVENAVARYSETDQASVFLRPMFDACIVGSQMAGQVAGRAMIRLRAVKAQAATQLGSGRSLLATPANRDQAVRIMTEWLEKNLAKSVLIHDPYFGPEDLFWIQLIRSARSDCEITVMTARRHQPDPPSGEDLGDVYSSSWKRLFDQSPPKTEIAVIGGVTSKESPIHDRWLVSGGGGLRFGTSLNSLGVTKDSEISELTPEDAEQRSAELHQYLTREKAEHKGEKLRLIRFAL